MRTLALVVAITSTFSATAMAGVDFPSPAHTLAKRSLDAVRNPDRVETFALEDVLMRPASTFPNATLVATDLPGRFLRLPEGTPVKPEVAQELTKLLMAPASYAPWMSACMFSPGVAIRFHKAGKAVDAFVCFHWRELAFQVVGEGRAIAKLSFDPVQERLFDLVRQARPADARLESVRQMWDGEAEDGRKAAAAWERWKKAMPASLHSYEKLAQQPSVDKKDVDAMEAALAAELPDRRARVLVLLAWFGSGAGPWSGFPAYEEMPERLLLRYSTADLLDVVQNADLTEPQIEGAARLFGGWDFGRDRPADRKLLKPELRERLLRHSLKSDDEDKRRRAERAFSSE